MRRLRILIPLLLLTALGASGCTTPAATQKTTIVDLKNDFCLTVFSDKPTYRSNEPIKIWATLKYIGSKDQVDIWHPEPYVSFSITDGKDFNMDAVYATVLGKTTLEKDKEYRFDFQKSGSYEPTASKSSFWKEFYNEKELYLPTGTYTIKVKGEFSLSMRDQNYNNNVENEVNIEVK